MPPKPYRLLDSEREYLENGTASGAYRPHELEDRIEEKVSLLPDRFEELFEDVKLLEKGYFESRPPEDIEDIEVGKPAPGEHYRPLATEEGYTAWLELMGFDASPTEQAVVEAFSYSGEDYGSAPAEFGVKLGKMVDRLMRWPDLSGIDSEDIIADLVWGFLKGLCFERRRAGDVTEAVIREDAADIIQRLEHRTDEYANACDRLHRSLEGPSRLGKRKEIKKEMAEQVNDILEEAFSVKTRTLATELAERHSMYSWDEFCSDVVDHLVDIHITDNYPCGSVGQWKAFWREYGPVEDFDVEEFVTEQRVKSTLDERRLFKRALLRTILDEDAEILADKKWRGVPAADVLHTIVDEEPISSRSVTKRVKNSTDHEGSVTRLAKDLAGQDCDSRPDYVTVWTDRQILRGGVEGWEPTHYGRAVNRVLRIVEAQEEPYLQPVQVMVFPEHLLQDALDEIDSSLESLRPS